MLDLFFLWKFIKGEFELKQISIYVIVACLVILILGEFSYQLGKMTGKCH
jgi:multisubunit Na+/H+ antiporter MnhE subunit